MRKIKDFIFEFIFNRLNKVRVYSHLENKYKFIYIHIPKTGGNGILKSLFNLDFGLGHKPLELYYKANRTKFDEYYKFTIVRNPYDRFVSAFNYLKAGGNSQVDIIVLKEELTKHRDVNDFISELKKNPELMVNVMNYVHFMPQTYFLKGNIRATSIDHIGKQEDMETSFNFLKNIFSLNNLELKKQNVTKGYNDTLSYDSKTFLYNLYEEDFRYFDYSSQL
ncbi:sulfotransferase family 2 domain-containing protein [Thalassomonas sp. M1454]|uniref:sulfotransferase family 2 domain-containing protein n=1 Tax=Thalassomonas sp. M1454 TaxID=2594477 RepID=UPI00163DB8F5|nr:sulfotransferase family 2 domain-containing protein [Thalassomonas sp. M1454]